MLPQHKVGDLTDLEFEDIIKLSDQFREEGNKLFKIDKLFNALAQYNKALVLARNDDIRSALCYGNRSAVYLKLEYFKHCLHNIELAEKRGYPRANIKKLYNRREQCLKMMETSVDKAREPFNHVNKLSFEANPKIPFFIDAIQLKKDTEFGKYLITTKDLKAGDVIAIIDNLWQVPVNDLNRDYVLGCYNCIHINNGDLIPGDCRALFCSEKCLNEHKQNQTDHKALHVFEDMGSESSTPSSMMMWKIFITIHDVFGSIDAMMKFVEANLSKSFDIFDFDWTVSVDDPIFYKNMLLLIMSECSKIDENCGMAINDLVQLREETLAVAHAKPGLKEILCLRNRIMGIFLEENPEKQKFIDKFLRQIRLNSCITACLVNNSQDNLLATATHPAMYLLKYSCDPNIFIHFENNKKIIWTANQPIPAGAQLLINSSNFYYRKGSCTSKENCEPCQKGWQKMIKSSKIDIDLERSCNNFYTRNDPTQLTNILKHKEECCDFINQNFSRYKQDAKLRQKIATKKEELRKNLNSIGSPFPAAGIFMTAKFAQDPLGIVGQFNRLGIQ